MLIVPNLEKCFGIGIFFSLTSHGLSGMLKFFMFTSHGLSGMLKFFMFTEHFFFAFFFIFVSSA